MSRHSVASEPLKSILRGPCITSPEGEGPQLRKNPYSRKPDKCGAVSASGSIDNLPYRRSLVQIGLVIGRVSTAISADNEPIRQLDR
jgi:hypothetical protein